MESKQDHLAWWREAKYGMFIHWGLYAVPAGIYKGEPVPGLGEWIMSRAKIPLREYRRFAEDFTAEHFDAAQWVSLAKQAQMKYIVITAKHHDGFAMYHSQCSKYNIVDATPFGRDPLKELAEECRKQGLKLCFYYSQAQDWEHPDGMGTSVDYAPEGKVFSRYMQEKLFPQLRELLTGYGPIGLMWFDTPYQMTVEQSAQVKAFVKSLQPECIVSGRIGNALGDYTSSGDNMIPNATLCCDWEVPSTLNDTWGYKENDHAWKNAQDLLKIFVNITHKGGNYLLNVGPDKHGVIPPESVKLLQALGDWLNVNGESIFNTIPCPQLPYEFSRWGDVTMGKEKLYLHIFQWPENRIPIHGLKNNIKKAYLLADADQKPLDLVVHPGDDERTCGWVHFTLPEKAPDPLDSVLVIETEGTPDFLKITEDFRFV